MPTAQNIPRLKLSIDQYSSHISKGKIHSYIFSNTVFDTLIISPHQKSEFLY